MNGKLLPTTVDEQGVSAMIRRLGRECGPTQYIREFVYNGIEAITRRARSGEVLVDVNWDLLDEGLTTARKISFTDQGDGMTGQEIQQLINKLSSSGATNKFENYGVGAKISSLAWSPAGVCYESWKDGRGVQALIYFDSNEKKYGLKPVKEDDGTIRYFKELDVSCMPRLIAGAGGSGTRVTLIGESADSDTMTKPVHLSGSAESWIFFYLNTRFFTLPDGVTVKVRIGHYRDRDDSKHNFLLNVKGQKKSLDENAVCSGIVVLSDANAHWWLLREGADGHGRECLRGHSAALNQGELFEVSDPRSSRVRNFGIVLGSERVVIYVEPKSCFQNQTRTSLLTDQGAALPWERWAEEFKSRLPRELAEYVQQLLSASSKRSHEDSIKDRLKPLIQLFQISRWRRASKGIASIDDSAPEAIFPTSHEKSVDESSGHPRQPTPGTGAVPGSELDRLFARPKAGSTPAIPAAPLPFPAVRWISVSDGTRSVGELEDRAARYSPAENLIIANRDFQGFQDLVTFFISAKFKDDPALAEFVSDSVIEQFEQQLIEVVTMALRLDGRQHWNPSDFDRALSEEALTTAVGARCLLVEAVNRSLARKIGGQHWARDAA